MSGDITEGKNNSFEDYYKTDHFDDSELQARLYAEIYHDSNIEDESKVTNVPRTIQFDSMNTETNVESERQEPEEQPSASITKVKDCQMFSTNQTEFAEVDILTDREINSMTYGCNNESLKDPSMIQRENEKNSSKNYKSSKYVKNKYQENSEKDNDAVYSKYNVDLKCVKKQRLSVKETDENKDSSDSEESIFEVPVPPKPRPLLIDLQDSDEESDMNSGIDMDDLILKKWGNTVSIKTYSRIIPCRNHGEIIETSNNQNIFFKSRNTDRSCNNNIVDPDQSVQTTSSQEKNFTEDIVLNCTTIQKGAKSISEIKQLSKNAGNQEIKSMEDINQRYKSVQNKSEGNDANFQQEMSLTSRRKLQMRTQQDKNNVYDIRHISQNKMSEMKSCNLMDHKRQCNNEFDNHPKQKWQCIIQQNNQDVMLQGSNDEEKRNPSWNEYFKPMSEEMKDYYNSSRGQENFEVEELQRGMSKDPRMWAILDEDIMPSPSSRQRTRFWNVRCTNCHRDGHQRYDCSSPRRMPCCYMCGMNGHVETQCPQKMCLTCGKQQNTFLNTCKYCRVLYCTMCNSIGHELEQCPDLWRRYHQTTDMSNAPQDPGNIMKPSSLLYCCNCAKRGHESSTCKEYRWSDHFSTPAGVTNYTDGPTYASSSSGLDPYVPYASSSSGLDPYVPYASSSSGIDPKQSFLSGAIENKTLIPQNTTDIQHVMTEDMKLSANVNPLSSSIDSYILPTSQEDVCISQMEENLKSSPVTSKIWTTVKTTLRQTKVSYVPFISITYFCGSFRNKNHKDARMILKDLSTFFQNRRSMLNSLINRKVTPFFLETLLEKAIEFEVKIGFTKPRTLSLQLLATKEYIEYLYDLLEHWLNLLDDEKDWIDVTLPINPAKMFKNLNSRMQQLEKMRFTCYADYKGTNHPQWIYTFIKNRKANMEQYKESDRKYNRFQKKLWQMQIKLLMIVNTVPKPNVFVRTFENAMKRFKSELHQMGNKLDTVTYLRFTLLYNQLFVPRTPDFINKILHRFANAEDQMLRNLSIEKNKIENNSLQTQQEPKITIHEQENFIHNVYSSSTSSYTPQNIKLENSSAISNQCNKMLIEEQNVNNILLDTSKITDHNCDKITIKSTFPQNSQVIMPKIEPASAKSENPTREKGQLLTSEVNIESNISVNKQNINMNTVDVPHLTKSQRKKANKANKKLIKKLNSINFKTQNIYEKALNLINKARNFEVPHMMNAADEMQRQINNQTMRLKHIRALSKLVQLEEKYQKNVNSYCRSLNI